MLRFLISIVFGVCIYSCAFAEEKLIFAIDLVRHGDRMPIMVSPEMEKIWSQSAGQLTPKGMRQEYELGKFLRQQYVEQYHLLPERYDGDAMRVRSSGLSRTLMSAQSLLYGLYPLGTGPLLQDAASALPQGLQPIPIQTVPETQDSLLIPNYDRKMYQTWLDTYVLNSPDWIQKEQSLKPHYAVWSKIFDAKISTLLDLIRVSDRLYIEQLYHVPLPEGLHRKDAEMILSAGKWAMFKIINHPQMASAAGSELAQTIQQELHLATEQNRSLKYLLFMAHDTTIMTQLKLLGQHIEDIPPYASRLNYSLFDMGSYYEVRVTYNQEPLHIDACGGEFCGLDEFIHLLNYQDA